MRILVLSATPWSNDNSFGNTFTNLFSGLPDIEVANIYVRYGMPDDNGIVSRYFQITEQDLLSGSPGCSFSADTIPIEETAEQETHEKNRYDFVRRHRWMIFYWYREWIWKTKKWDTKELRQFIDDFKPDLVYLPLYYCVYLLNIGLFLKKYTGVPMIGHISDDNYSLRQFSLSPFFWLDRFWKRGWIRKVVRECKFLHVITEKQKEEYESLLHKECRLFCKSMDFNENKRNRHALHDPIQFVYTGGVGNGRWKALFWIGKALDEVGGKLFIYSSMPLNRKMRESFDNCGSLNFMGAVSYAECMEIQENADVLVLVESSDRKERLSTRLSLSTKVVEYLHTGNCIFCVGPAGQAGMEHLQEGNAAICVTQFRDIKNKIMDLSPDQIRVYGDAAWEFGKKKHNNEAVKKRFYQDLLEACGER